MKVSASQPFQIIYSLYQHEYLGFIFESYIVHLDEKGKLTYQHQNISAKNAREFSKGLDDRDFELIEAIDSMHQDAIAKKFSPKIIKPEEFLTKIYDKAKGNELLTEPVSFFSNFRNLTASGFWSSRMGVDDLGYKGNTYVQQWDGCPAPQLEKLGLKA